MIPEKEAVFLRAAHFTHDISSDVIPAIWPTIHMKYNLSRIMGDVHSEMGQQNLFL